MTTEFKNFTSAYETLKAWMQLAPTVKTERWQGVAANLDTREVFNVNFQVDLRGIEDLDHWRQDIQPNLPWADDHFLERVGGVALNPGEQWKKWPWGQSASRFRGPQELGPMLAPQDWAYLAGMIDGDGSIEPRVDNGNFQGRISIGQKDRTVLDKLYSIFKVGTVYKMPIRTLILRGKDTIHDCHTWQIAGSANIRWITTNCLPYLRVKKKKAEEMILALDEGDKKIGHPKSHRKTVWNRDWPTRFNHTYMSRLWPKRLDGGSVFRGHNWEYGDLGDLINLLVKEPHTRQAWIPLFHPQDTGISDGGRKVCTLGYQIIMRDGKTSIWYPLRSCDLRRHYSDDAYLAVRMLLWIIDRCRERNPLWSSVVPGWYSMHMTSLHVFENDWKELQDGRW